MDQSTIYRTLETFNKFGLVDVVDNASSRQTYYTLKNQEEYHIVTCRHCGKVAFVYDCPCSSLNADAKSPSNYDSVYHKLEFTGICDECYPALSGRADLEDFSYKEEAFQLGLEMLRYRGFKQTKARAAVLKELVFADSAKNVQDILDCLDAELELDQSTVYRTLQTLIKLGLVNSQKEDSPKQGRKTTFSWKYRGHYHLIFCTECKRCELIPIPSRHDMVQSQACMYNFHKVYHHLNFFGKCPDCQNSH